MAGQGARAGRRGECGVPRRGAIALSLLAAVPRPARPGEGARLLMLERRDCPACRRWLREVGEAAWNGSDLGRRAPLRRVDVAEGLPGDLAGLGDWRFTPTFVLLAEGRELGRIIGYQSDWFFWQQAEALLARLPPARRREEGR